MAYVAANLMTGEEIVSEGKIHWFVYIVPIISIIASFFLMATDASVFGFLVLLFGILRLISAFIVRNTTELVITNRRIIAKFGFIRRNTVELLHRNVESLHVSQGVFGRLFRFGTIIVNGTGGVRTPVPDIDHPLEFRRTALRLLDNREQ
ncbi:PH domain-containing protein [Roseicella frigidaeris]|nr:PH domain-containing protein [Roseicella frigidaeris]